MPRHDCWDLREEGPSGPVSTRQVTPEEIAWLATLPPPTKAELRRAHQLRAAYRALCRASQPWYRVMFEQWKGA